jgi:hypothetical protein
MLQLVKKLLAFFAKTGSAFGIDQVLRSALVADEDLGLGLEAGALGSVWLAGNICSALAGIIRSTVNTDSISKIRFMRQHLTRNDK